MSRDSSLFKRCTSPKALPKGSYAEIGVLVGRTFCVLCDLAKSKGVMAHAFDSFRGMSRPTSKDLDAKGETLYPEGRFDVGGVDNFVKSMTKFHISRRQYMTWPGFVPYCFEKFPEKEKFCYVRLDLDQFEPTKLAAAWGLKKLNVGGILACHDYFKNTTILAAGAMNEFIETYKMYISIVGIDDNEIFIKKTGEPK